mmetsp:Transcript_6562/g.8538  ORF Transcript_6562/g.8538 Transcript_6562/m.8538 type:complete len:205 (-) Transcript_6562:497-1111(-)
MVVKYALGIVMDTVQLMVHPWLHPMYQVLRHFFGKRYLMLQRLDCVRPSKTQLKIWEHRDVTPYTERVLFRPCLLWITWKVPLPPQILIVGTFHLIGLTRMGLTIPVNGMHREPIVLVLEMDTRMEVTLLMKHAVLVVEVRMTTTHLLQLLLPFQLLLQLRLLLLRGLRFLRHLQLRHPQLRHQRLHLQVPPRLTIMMTLVHRV